jgi:hypothetical protein
MLGDGHALFIHLLQVVNKKGKVISVGTFLSNNLWPSEVPI